MAIETGMCHSYRLELMQGVHTLDDEYRMALYGPDADLSAETSAYTADGEVEGRGYEAGGLPLTGVTAARSGSAAVMDFDAPEWRASSIVAHGCMVYNASKDNRAVAVFSFGGEVLSRNGRFIIKKPSGGNGPVRIA